MELTIKPLAPALLDSYLRFFDQVAFTDNHDWEGCYCVYYHHCGPTTEWARRTKQENRAEAARLIRAGVLQGYLAFQDETVIGWCNVNRKGAYGTFLPSDPLSADGGRTAAVVCFVIAPGFRRHGVATALLARAVADLTAGKEMDYLEAYPRKAAAADAPNYHGPLAMYRRAGFTVAKELDDFLLVRKDLR